MIYLLNVYGFVEPHSTTQALHRSKYNPNLPSHKHLKLQL